MFTETRSGHRVAPLAVPAAAIALTAAGCGLDAALTPDQQQRDAALKMAWIDKAAEIAEKHGLAYRVEINATGRPSIGETVDLYFDTGLDARIILFGHARGDGSSGDRARREP